MRTVGYIPDEGAKQKVTKQGGTPTPPEPPEPKDDGTGTPVTEQTGTPTPPEPKDDPVKKGGKKE